MWSLLNLAAGSGPSFFFLPIVTVTHGVLVQAEESNQRVLKRNWWQDGVFPRADANMGGGGSVHGGRGHLRHCGAFHPLGWPCKRTFD